MRRLYSSSCQTTLIQRGFTLIELMVTVTVLGVLLAIGLPSFTSMFASNRIATQTNEFVAALNLARAESIRRGQPVALRADSGGIDYAGGWKVFTDADGDGDEPSPITATDGTPVRVGAATQGLAIRRVSRAGSSGSFTYTDLDSSVADRMYVVFNSRGANNAGAAAFFKICATTDSSIKGRILQVSSIGRVSLDSRKESC